MMSDFFSFSRFFKLLKEHWVRTWRTMLVISIIIGTLLIISLISYELMMTGSFNSTFKYNTVQRIIFELGFSITSFLFAFYWYYSNWFRSTKIATLNLPVSAFERLTLGFVWFNIMFVCWYLALFFIANSIVSSWAVQYEYLSYKSHPEYYSGPYKSSIVLSFFEPLVILNVIKYCLVIQAALYASFLWFKRYALLKSLAVVFIASISYYWFQHYFIPIWMNPVHWEYDPYTLRKMMNQEFSEFQEIQATPFLSTIQQTHLEVMWLVIWGVIYFRIKEQEV